MIARILSFQISIIIDNIVGLINYMSSNNASGYDGLSVTTFQLCSLEVVVPPQFISQKCINMRECLVIVK